MEAAIKLRSIKRDTAKKDLERKAIDREQLLEVREHFHNLEMKIMSGDFDNHFFWSMFDQKIYCTLPAGASIKLKREAKYRGEVLAKKFNQREEDAFFIYNPASKEERKHTKSPKLTQSP